MARAAAAAAQPKRPTPLPGATLARAAAGAVRRQIASEWAGSRLHLWRLDRPAATGFAAAPQDFRPFSTARGERTLAGSFVLSGEPLHVGVQGDPWNRPSPGRRFAIELHQFAWMPDLVSTGEDGAREALRLTFLWDAVFGRWNAFSWSPEILERRVFNIAVNAAAMSAATMLEEIGVLAQVLARNARQLSRLKEPAASRSNRLAACAVAGAALSGKAGRQLLRPALKQLARSLTFDVLPDGGHVTRNPEAGLELLFDLRTLDDVLAQRGVSPPVELMRAIDRLTAALRFFTLPDGRLPSMQGGEEGTRTRLTAARAHDDPAAAPPPPMLPHSGYQRMAGKTLNVLVDAGAPAKGAWSTQACAHPLALEVVCGDERLITNSGWSARAPAAEDLRLTPAGSTGGLGLNSAGRILTGLRARQLGAQLVDGAHLVEAARSQLDNGDLLELSHDGWLAAFGLVHSRRLFLDPHADELRGDDRFEPPGVAAGALLTMALRFHLHPAASATLARDSQSVLLRTQQQGAWWLRNDAAEVRIEPSVHFTNGRPKPTAQVILRTHFRPEKGGRVRWKLTPAQF